jgi:hypothetical protein
VDSTALTRSCFSIPGADLIVPGAGAIQKAALANLGVCGSFVLVALEDSACPIVFCHEDSINNHLSPPLSTNMAENTEVHLTRHTWMESAMPWLRLAMVDRKRRDIALLPAVADQHDIWLNRPLSWVACLVLSFLGSEQLFHIASGCSPSVPLLAAETVLKKQMYSWSLLGNTGRNKASMVYCKEHQIRSEEHGQNSLIIL